MVGRLFATARNFWFYLPRFYYSFAELYNWHGALTGSCRFGRSQFQREHGLKDEDTLSLEEFVELCGNAYGGEKIKKLLAD